MEGSESEKIFDSLNLNPQLFINEVRNAVDDMVDGAFEFYEQKALAILRDTSKEEANELSKGVSSLSSIVQEVLDRRLDMWEKYCLQHCFVVPKGFSLPKADKSDDNLMDLDVLSDTDLDLQLDSLREKLFLADKEAAELQKEHCSLEKQYILSNKCAESVTEVLQLFEENSVREMFQEMVKTSNELHEKMKNLKIKKTDELRWVRKLRMRGWDEEKNLMHQSNGFYHVELKDIQDFVADLKNI